MECSSSLARLRAELQRTTEQSREAAQTVDNLRRQITKIEEGRVSAFIQQRERFNEIVVAFLSGCFTRDLLFCFYSCCLLHII